ncbi:MAG: hypothetical protein ABIJ26_06880 [Candidatus Margulisiibacteriota bacterium]|nr:hypothetical protein [Candidatus Margulisiibacteriota bacterium]
MINERAYEISKTAEMIEYIALAVIAIALPLVLKHPQLLVGSAVNFALILAAINMRGWPKMLPLIILPSVSALAGGYLFGVFTAEQAYFIPFIWIANTLLVLLIKKLYVSQKKNYLAAITAAGIMKAGFLFAAALALSALVEIPVVFLTAMGGLQLITVLIGGLAAWPVSALIERNFINN